MRAFVRSATNIMAQDLARNVMMPKKTAITPTDL